MIVVYALKAEWTYQSIPAWGIALLILCIPILLSVLSIRITSKLGSDSIHGCSECSLADQEFLPVYLGYFFISLSVPDDITMLFLYIILVLQMW